MSDLNSSREIINQAIVDVKPVATVLALSGGNDSLSAYYAAKALDVKVDFILHVNTRTGIQETTDFVRSFALIENAPYIEADAKDSYEKYLFSFGFFGIGHKAHTFAYHLLKAQHIRAAISKHIRQRKRNRPVVILSGARIQESDNRSQNFSDNPIDREPNTSNFWVKPLHYWSKDNCLDFLSDCKATCNPVTKLLCRSGECMCGTMQSEGARLEASHYFPKWGRWLDELERRVMEKFPWRWGQDISRLWHREQLGQMRFTEFQPLCSTCKVNPADHPLIINGKEVST